VTTYPLYYAVQEVPEEANRKWVSPVNEQRGLSGAAKVAAPASQRWINTGDGMRRQK